jgi:glycosyltransferase involved in cell wall biosynthesis
VIGYKNDVNWATDNLSSLRKCAAVTFKRRKKPLTIVFAHSNLGQFRHLHEYLNSLELACSYLLCSEANFRKYKDIIPNLIPFTPHGNKLTSPESFYYLSKVEQANRRSLGIRSVLSQFLTEHLIDIFVCHISAGSPSMLFDEFPFPIVTYLEFPCFKSHGWDMRFPPPEIKQLRDKNFEMLSYHAVIKSDKAIVPSKYARSLFPTELQPKIDVITEGFAADSDNWFQGGGLEKKSGYQYIGFAARDLSTAKGFDQFVRIANLIASERPNIQFVVLGSPNLLYSYENHFLDAQFGVGHNKTFCDWVLDYERSNRSRFTLLGKVDYEIYSRVINDIDLFLYPLQFGSSNWGLFEILGRGRIVIASNCCYVPEVITHGENGFLCAYENVSEWVRLALEILDNIHDYRFIGENARGLSSRYSITRTADDFLSFCNHLVDSKGEK